METALQIVNSTPLELMDNERKLTAPDPDAPVPVAAPVAPVPVAPLAVAPVPVAPEPAGAVPEEVTVAVAIAEETVVTTVAIALPEPPVADKAAALAASNEVSVRN